VSSLCALAVSGGMYARGASPSQSPSQMKVNVFRSVEGSTLRGEDADRATLFRFASFLPLDRAPVFRELRPDEVHERTHASRAAKIGMGQHP
jgi:hypothetical protein